MKTDFPLLLEYGGERQSEVEVRTSSHTSRFPQRHDPPRSNPNRLIVRKENGLFTLREFMDGKEAVLVRAMDAQMIQDYLNANWPVGTVAQWIIVPPFRPCSHGPAGRPLNRWTWIHRVPIGARL